MCSESEIFKDLCRDTSDATFGNVCGYLDVKQCLKSCISALVDDKDNPSPLLLYGHPGVGKTQLLRAAAAEAQVRLLVCSPYSLRGSIYPKPISEAIKYVYDTARRNGPAILCFEDLHVLWRQENKEYLEAKEEFLTQLEQCECSRDGQDSSEKNSVAVIVDSTVPWLLDSELIKRFKLLHVELPSIETRRELIRFHLRHTSYELTDDDVNELAEKSAGFTGSDICCLVKDAEMQELRRITKAKFFKKILVPTQTSEAAETPRTTNLADGNTPEDTAEFNSTDVEAGVHGNASREEGGEHGEQKYPAQNFHHVEKFVPCHERDEGAVQMSLWDLAPELIHCPEPQVTQEAMTAALARKKPPLDPEEAAQMIDFRERLRDIQLAGAN